MRAKSLKVSQKKSSIGRLKSHQQCLRGLGLRRISHSVEVAATPENLGMIRKIAYMLKIEDV